MMTHHHSISNNIIKPIHMKTYDSRDLALKIDPKKLKPLFKTDPLKHGGAILYNWIIILGMISLWTIFPTIWLFLIGIIVIGARMHALAILMHDATHFRFLKNRKWNDRITNWFTMYPVYTTIHTYRKNHLAHHQNLNTEEDPDWVAKLGKREFTFPKTKTEFLLGILSYFTLYQGIADAIWFAKRFGPKKGKLKDPDDSKKGVLFFHMILFTVLTICGWWKLYLLFWVIPYLSTFFMFQYIRSVAEHFGDLEYNHLLTSTRTVKTNILEEFFIAPHGVGYHLEHHLFPAVPFYHLPKLHDLLMEQSEYASQAHVTIGYMTGLMQELKSGHQHQVVEG